MGRQDRYFDWLGVLFLLCLGIFGLFLLLTIEYSLFTQQFAFLVVSLVLVWIVSRVQSTILWWLTPMLYVVSNALLLLTYANQSVRGAARWISVFGVQFQPSELAKPLLMLVFARAIAQFPPRKPRYIPLHIILFIVPFFLIFKQPDLGTSLVYAGVWLSMMIAGGLSFRIIFMGIITSAVFIPASWWVLADYQKSRILTFLNPSHDPQGAGYNAIQSVIAVGSGQLFGRGLGRGTQSHLRFLPEFHTDFIFATLIEELGFFGGFALLVLYGLLLWRVLSPLVMGVVKDIFPYTYSIGLFVLLLVQITINVGMNMGLIPVTGITLPLVSYGGSSLISVCLSFGILWALLREEKSSKSVAIG